ncbi:hypothetical protein [Sphaerisporangium fuscum]|uniref:hypothetical protein n=1 Tax=Sphaerisporangium fuscum TaxID=2835868 RepID=UPI001BDD93D0|nr:hypothetical protein [Sphaerisporangium fuscum]
MTVLVAAAGIGATAAFGGLAKAPPSGPPQARMGEEVDQDLFHTKIVDAVVHTVPSGTGSGSERTVLDLDLRVFNQAQVSVRADYLAQSFLTVVSRDGELVLDTTNPRAQPNFMYDAIVPGAGVPSRLLPPKRTSTVLMRFRRLGADDADKYPSLLDITLGKYENHEDALTGRRFVQLVTDDGKPEVVARLAVPVRKDV